MEFDQESINLFILDMEDDINIISSGLLALENNHGDLSVIDGIMRSAHNLKGSSSMMGFNNMKDITHAIETVMQQVRSGKLEISRSVISLLFKCLDRILLIKDQILNNEDNITVSDLIEEINNISQQKNAPKLESTPEILPTSIVEPAKKHESNQYIKVSTKVLNNLLSQTNKLILMQTRLSGLTKDLIIKNHADISLDESLEIINRAGKSIRNIQDELLRTKMTSLDTILNKFPRMVRDLEISLGKKIELMIEAGNVKLDQKIADEISNPLMHIIRNSADHGLELPEERLEQGKSKTGLIKISASNKGNQLTIIVEDDGKGLDEEKILKTAINKGLIASEDAGKLSKQNIINLIFSPGFSTADKVTDVSGRGVGMDVVKTHIEKINGALEISSEKGKGTKIILKAPSTISVISCTMIEINKKVFCLPSININRVLNISKKNIESSSSFDSSFNDSATPLVNLHSVFGGEPKEYNGNFYAVVLGLVEKRAMILVDRILGSQKVIVKPLGNFIGKLPIISGATILEDSKIGLVLDVSEIVASYPAQN